MPVARPEPQETRVIAHVDLDCFYVQVEQRKRPELRGKPTAVVQYNSWKGGGLIAVGYEARQFGVTRNMRGDEAKKLCPDIHLVQVPVSHGKADLTIYRDAGTEVVSILSRKGICERASIDEVYLDITEAAAALSLEEPHCEEALKSHIIGYTEDSQNHVSMVREWITRSEADTKDRMLACGAILVAELRMAVLSETGFTCSAGVAHNKMLAKLASGLHKPAQQTLVPSSSVPELLAALPVKKMKQLGGKLGDSLLSDLHVTFIGDLLNFSKSKLEDLYGVNTGMWLWNVARGINGDEVKDRTLPKSHSCGKTFPGPKALKRIEDVHFWIKELALELQERLNMDIQQNHRMAHLLTVHAKINHVDGVSMNHDTKFPSKSSVLRYGKEKITQDAVVLFERALCDYMSSYTRFGNCTPSWAITSLYIGASNIQAIPAGVNPITKFFASSSSSSLGIASCSKSLSPAHKSLLGGQETMSESRSENYVGEPSDCLFTPLQSCCDIKQDSYATFHEHLITESRTDDEVMQNRSPLESNEVKCKKSLGLLKLEDIWSSRARVSQQYNASDTHNIEPLWGYKEDDIDMTVLSELPKEIQEEFCKNKTQRLLKPGVSKKYTLQDTKNVESLWSYNEEEIDMTVLSELPKEIQEELIKNLTLKRPRLDKKCRIDEFFKA